MVDTKIGGMEGGNLSGSIVGDEEWWLQAADGLTDYFLSIDNLDTYYSQTVRTLTNKTLTSPIINTGTLNSPTMVTPILGTPASGNLVNCTGFPASALAGTSADLAAAISDETGSGALVFATSPTLVTPILGTPTSGDLRNADGYPEAIMVAVSDETTAIEAGTGTITFRAPYALTLTGVRASLATASSSGVVTFDINVNGSTILSTKLTIDANEKTSETAATAAVISNTAIADDDEITIDIDTAGTGAAGAKITFLGRQ